MRAVAAAACLGAALWLAPAGAAGPTAGPQKVLRVAFEAAETSFDPVAISDLYSATIAGHIFEALYTYDHLARPPKIVPLTAAAMPEVSQDFRVWKVKLRPGIFFAADPAFNGAARELVAEDYVYALKRFADPANKSPGWTDVETFGIEGLKAARDASLNRRRPFDYDIPLAGLRSIDRYTLEIRLERPQPSLLERLAISASFGAVAREVVERYGTEVGAHPVGTGPFRLAQWRRASFIALERNPGYREHTYDARPDAADAEGQALLAGFKGRRLPMVDRVEVSIIEEDQPLWLSFLNGSIDQLAVPDAYVDLAMPNGRVAPNLARRGIQGQRTLRPSVTYTYFNMNDPVVGGMAPEKVALRRAISLGIDIEREIRLLRRGQAIPAQSPLMPFTTGYDAAFKSVMSDHDPARAKALLDIYGYADRDGDGFRELPDGKPLVLEIATQPDRWSRQFDELWELNMRAIGLRTRFVANQWPEQLRRANAGTLMMWTVGQLAVGPDGRDGLALLHGPQAGGANLAHFRLPEMDAIYERLGTLEDGPEREALFRRAKLLAVAYMPYRFRVHGIANDLVQPWLVGYRRGVFPSPWWHLVDIDHGRRPH